MVDTTVPGRRAAVEYAVERLSDPVAIRDRLAAEGAYAGYALAQLSPTLFPQTDWWTASGPGASALVLHSRGGLGHAMVTFGDAEALDALLGLHSGPRFSFASFRPEHRETVERHFVLMRDQLMVRMSVTAESFKPIGGEAERLRGTDIGRVNRLYASEGGPAAYSARHVDQGVYFGVLVEGKLVSIAGTHVDAPSERIAVVGNVFTHPLYRGGGLATIATSAVTRELLQRCDSVVLTVEANNEPALAVYDKLGYRHECNLYETAAARRDALGVVGGLRRLIASWRGRSLGKEIVLR